MTRRLDKVNELIKQEVGKIIEKEIGSDFGFLTVTNVYTKTDLHFAEIWISLYNEKIENPEEFLNQITPEIQKILNKRLNLKYVPKIILKVDKSTDYAFEIEKILNKVKK